MNTLQGKFYSTSFRVRDEEAFKRDPVILDMQRYMDLFSGPGDGVTLHCIASKDIQPIPPLEVHAAAIRALLADTSSDIAIEDSRGWLLALQRHLEPDSGIAIDETVDGQRFMTYVAADRLGWTRKRVDR